MAQGQEQPQGVKGAQKSSFSPSFQTTDTCSNSFSVNCALGSKKSETCW